ncbi:MAG: FAD-dependent oxidoreductase [Betaproteobacteria bacterium]|nr:FAD-dependent oxidoreductase [Betaproteobacteria bacterium]
MNESNDFDVVVVGGGIAGLTAASRAAEQGLRVALLERGTDERYLCNSRYSGGVIHLAFHNVKEPPEALFEVIKDATAGNADPALARALATTSGRAVDWLQQQGAKFIRVGNIVWQQWVLAPPRPITPGLDWRGRGPDLTLRTLAANLEKRGGKMLRNMPATALMQQAGRCTGVEATNAEGVHHFKARAVILADGGFQGNAELVRQHISAAPEKLKQRGAGTGVGDGLRMAQALGAHVTEAKYFYGHMLSRDAFTNDKVWPYPQLDELGTVGIVVNTAGERFVDEGLGGVYVANVIAKLENPLAAWAIFDEAIWEGPGRTARIPANPNYAKAGGTILKANSFQELAVQTGIPAERLELTIGAYNAALSAARLDTLNPPRTSTKLQPLPLSKPPYYAVPLCAGITYTFGGIATDEHGRVRRPGGAPIDGLYAIGVTTGGLEGGTGCGYVGGLIRGVVFGLRAAEQIAQERR